MTNLIELLNASKLRILRLRLTIRAARTATLPPFLGSTLRGAFGKALKPKACLRSVDECRKKCLELACCYRILFEGNPAYVIQSSSRDGGHFLERGDTFTFDFLLFGPAIESGLLICAAMYDAGLIGFGVARVPFELIRIEAVTPPDGLCPLDFGDGANLQDHSFSLVELVNHRLSELIVTKTLRVRFPTRLRREVSGREQFQANPELPFSLFASMAANRIAALSEWFGTKIDPNPYLLDAGTDSVVTMFSSLEFTDLTRYSDHHKTKLQIGGLHGEIVYHGDALRLLLPLLVAGEIVHIGSQTSMGLGRYELSPV